MYRGKIKIKHSEPSMFLARPPKDLSLWKKLKESKIFGTFLNDDFDVKMQGYSEYG
jgi:hypothetical protein